MQGALTATFLAADRQLAHSGIDCELSGCTCTVAHLEVRVRVGGRGGILHAR
jgi:hypothetical protein